MSCSVCCEDYNNSTRSQVKCFHCDYEVCASCASTYLCETPEYAHCMNCKKSWDRGFLSKQISKSFLRNKYKKAREKHLFDKEMALMPATQPAVEQILYGRKQYRKIHEFQEEIDAKRNELRTWYSVDVPSKKAAIQLEVEIFMLMKKIELCKFKLNHKTSPSDKKTFIRKCGYEGCRGFLSTQWKCGICNKYTCKECLEIKDENHECNPSNVETAKLLATDSRPCPKCGTFIFKIEGCDQMYCTMCNTAFSWRSGLIVTGRIHNPHYYEFMRNRGTELREIGDVPCGGLPMLRHMPKVPAGLQNDIWGAHRLWNHIQEITMYTLVPKDTNQYRIKYLLNELDQDEFCKNIQRIEKANSKKLEYRLIYTTFCDVVSDLFRTVTSSGQWEKTSQELRSLAKYVNEQFELAAEIFDCKAPRIYLPGWSLYPPLAQ